MGPWALDTIGKKHQRNVAKSLASTAVLVGVSVAPPPFDLGAAVGLDFDLRVVLISLLLACLLSLSFCCLYFAVHARRCLSLPVLFRARDQAPRSAPVPTVGAGESEAELVCLGAGESEEELVCLGPKSQLSSIVQESAAV